MVILLEGCVVIGVRYVAVVVMVTAVLVSLSVEAVFNVPVILIVVGATVRESSGAIDIFNFANASHSSTSEILSNYFVFWLLLSLSNILTL